MKYVEVGGLKLSAIGLGTWQFGSREWAYGDDYADRESIAITHRALDLGVNLIDTAEIYGFGRSERIVGQAVRDRRAEAFVATKVFPVLPVSSVVQQRALASADRLRVERIDLYQVHWPNPVVPIKTTMEGMARLQRTGLVGHVGVSNFSLDRWRAAEHALGSAVLSNQVQYSLVSRRPERDLLPWAEANDRLVIAYSPLAQGFLSGRYDGTNTPRGVRASNALFLPQSIEMAKPLFEALREIARSHDATPAQVALAWVIRHPNVVAIPGASSVSQLEANVAAADLALTDEEATRLDEVSTGFDPPTGLAAAAQLIKSRFAR